MVVQLDTGYAPWLRRALAWVLDALPVVGMAAIALGVMWFSRIRACDGDTSALDLAAECATGISVVGRVAYGAAWLAVFGYAIWNLGYRQGRTGSSLGKSVVGIRVVGADTAEPVGFWWSLIRQCAHVLDVFSLGIGYLWPLWDRRNRTFADMLTATVCVRSGFSGRR